MCSAKSRLRGMLYLRLEGLGRQGMEGRAMFAEETAENILEFNNIKMTMFFLENSKGIYRKAQ